MVGLTKEQFFKSIGDNKIIIQPKVNNNFLVKFDRFGNYLSDDELIMLSKQIASLNQPNIIWHQIKYDDLIITFRDDVLNIALNGVTEQLTNQEPHWLSRKLKNKFNITIFDGFSYCYYDNCWIKEVYFDKFSYDPSLIEDVLIRKISVAIGFEGVRFEDTPLSQKKMIPLEKTVDSPEKPATVSPSTT